ncbi:hypothetical protein C8R43DRAFT_590298 [Mycena crocata]|nr:hypothetical protein C8R43DRAFT_590298 [Mycena crocata]
MAMEGELPRQPADFAKWVGTVVEANTTLKGLLAKSDKRTLENRVGQVAEGFYVFVAAIWYATGKNKGPTLDWLASLLEPLVKAAGRSLSSTSTWHKVTRTSSQTGHRAAHETHLLENIRKLQADDIALKNNRVYIPADSNTPVLHPNEDAPRLEVPEVRVQPPASSEEGSESSSPVRELHQMQRLNEAASRSEVAAAMQSEARSRPAHWYAHLQNTAPRENAFAPTLLNPGDDEPNPFGLGDLDRELDERASFLAVRELILAGDPATMDFLRDPLPSPAVAPRRPLAPRMLNLTDVLDLPQEFEFKAHVRASTGPASLRYL